MKKYLLFAGCDYYPSGGADDFIESFDEVSDAVASIHADSRGNDWYHVVDRDTMKIAYKGRLTE